MKNLLVIYYSQTGRLKEITANFAKPWNKDYNIDFVEVKCPSIPFPMGYKQFFEVFPETVLKLPAEIHYTIPKKDYDCIILGFQPWFLHTSIPFCSFMQTEDFRNIVKNKPVILVEDSRNTWRNSLKEVIEETEKNAGNIKGIFVFRDTAKNRSGIFSLFGWLFTGKKKTEDKSSSVGGISSEIIDSADVYGTKAMEALNAAERVYTVIPHVEKEYTSIEYEQWAINKYLKWAKFIGKNNFKHRRLKMLIFRVWLLFMFFFLTPFIAKKGKK
jgi:flavodoxin